jgi:hypothetical protein
MSTITVAKNLRFSASREEIRRAFNQREFIIWVDNASRRPLLIRDGIACLCPDTTDDITHDADHVKLYGLEGALLAKGLIGLSFLERLLPREEWGLGFDIKQQCFSEEITDESNPTREEIFKAVHEGDRPIVWHVGEIGILYDDKTYVFDFFFIDEDFARDLVSDYPNILYVRGFTGIAALEDRFESLFSGEQGRAA